VAAEPAPSSTADELFHAKVRPLLKAKCLGCHGDDPKLQGKLDLRTREAAIKGGRNGSALVPGKADASPIYTAVLRTGELVMPPKETGKLTPAEIADLKAWIDAGAPWPAERTAWAGKVYDPADTWAYRPVADPPAPVVKAPPERLRNEIDAFLEAKLVVQGIVPAGPASREVLVRRAYFDLTGLPPTPAQADAFVRDPAPDAFERLIDALLASPHYGERMAQHWLDVVRYADTAGFSNDYERPNAWRYRDYVIRSFNRDKPFDRFIVEQIAGDELAPGDPVGAIAVGFLRMGPWEHTAMSVAALTRQMWLDDVTNAVGVTFLGQGLSCCRCHDHKFDPLPTRDYYRIQAVFAGTQFADAKAPFLPEENTAGFAGLRQAVVEQYKHALVPLTTDKGKDDGTFGMVNGKRDQYHKLALKRFEPAALSVRNDKAAPVVVLKGGSLENPGAEVAPGVLSAVHGSDDSASPNEWNRVPTADAGRRLALARWIADRRNTLTARVVVNRVWQWHFGTGLVATPNNFGKMGGRPAHPELLDRLATVFVDGGWSIKKLHRLIMTSAAYRRAGEPTDAAALRTADPSNRLLSYFPPRRLSAEEIRDAALAISGELNPEAGGPGVFPEINRDVATQPRHVMGGIAPAYRPGPRPEQRNRRTIYTFRYRTLADPMLEVLNRPGADMSCERRDETTVTPQVFALFNSQAMHDRALALAARLAREAAEPAAQVDLAFRLVLGRLPTASQRRRALEHVRAMTEHHRTHPPVRVELPATLTRKMIAERTGEAFLWQERLEVAGYVADVKPWDVPPAVRALAELCLVLLNSNEFVYVY
jgi:hypothetical protein